KLTWELLSTILRHLRGGPALFAEGELTDKSMRVVVSDVVREKVMRVKSGEITYVTPGVTGRFAVRRRRLPPRYCVILVGIPSQKKIMMGKEESRNKEIALSARRDIEQLLGHRCHMELFVKVEEDWRNSAPLLDEFGLGGQS